ncbi:MAG: molybdopterin-guanine dinucleotide biosynthesis protein B [Bacillota bacterium]
MLPVVSIVGRSDSGKTTLLEQLIPKLQSRGYQIATIKHHGHDFEIDKPGKDTWVHRQAGAKTVILSAPRRLAKIEELDSEVKLDRILTEYLNNDKLDLVITEGYKSADKPKIEVYRPNKSDEPLFSTADEGILAIVENKERSDQQFSSQQVSEIANLIIDHLL